MRRTFECFVGCLVLSLVAVPIAAAQSQQPPKPGPEHQRLAYYVGKWSTEGKMEPSPMGPGGTMTSIDTCEWFEGRFAVVCHYEGKTPIGPSKGLGILSYNADEKVYTYYGTDSSGMTMTTIPRGTVQGDTWTYMDESMMGGQKMKTRVTIKELSANAYTFKMEMQGPDGKWAPMMESKSTKVK
jgi:hypothetical protein